jgi:hypothetical protein
MKVQAIILLTAACAFLAGCGHGSSSSSSDAAATQALGVYAAQVAMADGSTRLLFVSISPGYYEARIYFVAPNNPTRAAWQKYSGADVVARNIHTVSLSYATCAGMPASDSFPITAIDSSTINVHSNLANIDMKLEHVTNIQSALISAGIISVQEDLNCDEHYN